MGARLAKDLSQQFGGAVNDARLAGEPGIGSHEGHHHFIPKGLVADVEGDKVRLSARADALESIFETEQDGSSTN